MLESSSAAKQPEKSEPQSTDAASQPVLKTREDSKSEHVSTSAVSRVARSKKIQPNTKPQKLTAPEAQFAASHVRPNAVAEKYSSNVRLKKQIEQAKLAKGTLKPIDSQSSMQEHSIVEVFPLDSPANVNGNAKKMAAMIAEQAKESDQVEYFQFEAEDAEP